METPDTLKFIIQIFDLGIQSLPDRIKAQKVIYLLKELGIADLQKYEFSFYVYGPYSSKLADDLYNIFPIKEISKEIDASSRVIISQMNKFLQMLNEIPSSLSQYKKLQYAADIKFKLNEGFEKEKIYTYLSQRHSEFKDRKDFDYIYILVSNLK